MEIDSTTFQVRAGEQVDLKRRPTSVKAFTKSKEQHQEIFAEHIKELSALQNLLYASNRYWVILNKHILCDFRPLRSGFTQTAPINLSES